MGRYASPSPYAHAKTCQVDDDYEDLLRVKLQIPSRQQQQQQKQQQQQQQQSPQAQHRKNVFPRLIISDTDAKRLKLVPQDLVFVGRVWDDSDTNVDGKGILLLHVQIAGKTTSKSTYTATTPPSSSSSSVISTPRHSSRSTTVNKDIVLRSGIVQIITTDTTCDLFDCLSSSLSLESHSTKSPTPDSPNGTVRTPSSSSDTVTSMFRNLAITNKQALLSPGQIRTTPTASASRNSNATFLPVWVTPTHSPVGQILQRLYCRRATRILIQKIDASSSSKSPNESRHRSDPAQDANTVHKIQERLVMAYYHDQYVRISNKPRPNNMQISFRGKAMEFQLVDVFSQNNDNNDKRQEKFLQNLQETIKNKDEVLSERARIILSQLIPSSPSKPSSSNDTIMTDDWKWRCWYRISHETRVQIVSKDHLVDAEATATVHTPQKWVAGLNATVEQVQTLLWTPLLRPEMFGGFGIANVKPPRGVLLYGPSGVGKTCLAKQILSNFAMLHDNSIPSEYVHCASLQSQATLVGVAERNLKRLFSVSKNNEHGKLLVLDDIHLIAPLRGDPQLASTTSDRLTATLLALLDGLGPGNIDSNQQNRKQPMVVILAITSNPSMLDPALRRPGRLDVEVEVPTPDEASTRAEILQLHLQTLGGKVFKTNKDECCDMDDEGWLELANLAKGFNGADCMLAVKEAMRSAILDGTISHINKQIVESEISPRFIEFNTESNLETLSIRVEHLRAAIQRIKPSAIKSVATVEIPKVLWSSIGGMETVKRELREAIEVPLGALHGEWLERLRVPPPRGILLYGPPGCSKTLMARALATEGRMNFLAVKGPELLSKWLGESERALASLFRRARMASPSIIFFDEIDAIASKRGGFGDSSAGSSSSRLLSQLLTELDGVNHPGIVTSSSKTPPRVVVVGATNRPDLLDNALTRPGRIDRMIYVGVPDSESRARILEITLAGQTSLDEDIDIPWLASDEISHGFSGAEMVAICRDAALLALEESDSLASTDSMPKIAMRHLLQATKDMQRQITHEMLEFYNSYRERTGSNRIK
jgi:SpoVK/Ycf46/Vps4 family AAA+-type ATPase